MPPEIPNWNLLCKKIIGRFFNLTTKILMLLWVFNGYAMASKNSTSPQTASSTHSDPVNTSSISSNPAAVNVNTGSGFLQQLIEKKLCIHDNHGIEMQGVWIGDSNDLFSGGIPNAKKWTSNSVGLVNLTIDTEHFNGWKGGLFSAQLLQQNAQNTNGQAGVIQGYNSLPDVPPYSRTELYALWYRQSFLNDIFFLRIGKTITTLDFYNVVKPIPLSKGDPNIPAVTSLIYVPVFINPAVDGIMPGYTNSAYGVTATYTPVKYWYLSYGIYDGNLASGKQTGLTGPTFNGNYFQVGETGSAWRLGKKRMPGTIGIGLWQQTGLIRQNNFTEMSASGGYLFGSQRLWYRHPGFDTSGISAFYQYGVNNSSILPMKQSIGAGLTAFGLIANRDSDSIGVGFSLAWLNRQITNRKSEFMLQLYYQAKLFTYIYLEPAFSFIPNQSQSTSLNSVMAGTLRAIVLF